MKTKYILSILFSVLSTVLIAQKKTDVQNNDSFLSKGTKEYKKENYSDAEMNYRISASKNMDSPASSYNLGNAIYSQKQPAEAKYAYMQALEKSKTRPEKHKAFHNLGNAYMSEKKYTEAVNAYKNALINNPKDEQTRYNYALAKQLLKDNPPPPQDDKQKDKQGEQDKKEKDKNNQNNKDKNKDQQNQDNKDQNQKDKKNDQGNQDKDQQNGDKDQQNQQQPKPQPSGISKQQVENMLEAVNNEEKKVQEKVNLKKVKGQPAKRDKEW